MTVELYYWGTDRLACDRCHKTAILQRRQYLIYVHYLSQRQRL
jgi:hypothetical protein